MRARIAKRDMRAARARFAEADLSGVTDGATSKMYAGPQSRDNSPLNQTQV
jgi:hypothetical protein